MDLFSDVLSRLKHELRTSKDQEIAAALGMSKTAFSERKKRNSFPEKELYALAATRPDLQLDIAYILTGMPNTVGQAVQQIKDSGRLGDFSALGNTVGDAQSGKAGAATQTLPPDEQMWLDFYREWSPEVKKRELRRAMGVSPSGTDQPGLQQPSMGNNNQVNSGPGAVQIKGTGNLVMPRRK